MSAQLTILVVDDSPEHAQTLTDILTMKGYAAYTAYSAAEALEILENNNVHILLADVVMPDMNGAQLYHKALETHPRLIAFLMTGYAADDIIQQGLDDGVKTVLIKPVDIRFFLDLVTAVEQDDVHKPTNHNSAS